MQGNNLIVKIGLFLIFFCISEISIAQTFTIDGISGIEFDDSNGDYSVTITDGFTIFGILVNPGTLTLTYSEDDNTFEIDGTVTTSFEEEEIEAEMDFVVTSRTLQSVAFNVSTDFVIKSLTISPSDLGFEWTGGTNFSIYGDMTVTLGNDDIDASFGDSNDPGIIIENGSLTRVFISITTDFSIESLEIAPDDLTFKYDTDLSEFVMYGDITFKIGDDEITAILGDEDDPGLIMDKNDLKEINIGITEDFSVSGLKIETNDLGVEWKSGSKFYLYGDANLSIENETIDTDFGTSSDPGIVIKNGSLHSFEVDVNSDLKFGDLEVTSKDVDIKYSSSKFEVTGEIEIDEVFSLSVDLGSGDQAGLEIDVSGSEPKFKIDELTIDIEHANLGTIDLKNFELEFNSSGIEESDVDVVFPSGTEIDATIKFTGDPATIDEISISYTADNLEEAIELFEGVQIAYASGTVGNLTHTSDLSISAEMDMIYGGGFTLDGKSATLMETGTSLNITSSYLMFSSSANVGAYKSGDDWKSLLGDGSIFLNINFNGSVLALVTVDIPSDPLVKASATVYFDTNKDFDALVDVTFYVPSSIPFIGGDKLGSVDGAIRYKYGDLSDSYAAGWTKIKTFWHTYHLGAKYKFSSRSISTFSGSGTISDIEDDISDDINSKVVNPVSKYVTSYHTFQVYENPVPPSMLLISADWGKEIDSVMVSVIGPEGVYELTRAIALTDTNTTTVPEFDYEENLNWVIDDTAAVFVLTTPTAFSEEEIAHSTLIDGRYQVVVTIPADQIPDSVSLNVFPVFQAPTSDINVSKTDNYYEIDLDYWSLIPDSTHLSVYVNTTNNYDSARLITHIEAENFDEDGNGTESITYSPDFLSEEDTLYFFSVIDDGYNPPEKSSISEAILHAPDLYGTISFPSEVDSLKEGLRVFVDEDADQSFDTKSTGGLELFSITSSDGQFALSGLENGTYEVRIVLPPGFRIKDTIDRFSHIEITFEGKPIELDIEIEAFTMEEN